MEWVKQHNTVRLKPLLWLYGGAGAGKSAICRTIAEMCDREGLLIASFFFSRTSFDRDSVERLVATLAYQLALAIPGTREHIQEVVENDPSIFDRDLGEQFEKLIAQPILSCSFEVQPQSRPSSSPKLIIIDGLDECQERRMQHHILTTIVSRLYRHNLPLIFLISSRSEYQILTTFNSPELDDQTARIPLDHTAYQSDADIRLFLLDKFTHIRNAHPLSAFIPSTWPTEQVIDQLVMKSSGHFIYVSTVMKYVESPQHKPLERLDIILGVSKFIFDTAAPFAELDGLYVHILGSAQNIPLMKRILGVLIMGEVPTEQGHPDSPSQRNRDKLRSPQFLCALLFIAQEDLYLVLNELRSLISVQQEGNAAKISVLHASLGDFLSDPSRSGDFHIKPSEVHVDLARACMRIIADVRNGPDHCHSLTAVKYANRNILLHSVFGDATESFLSDLRCFDLTAWLRYVPSDGLSGIYATLSDYISWLKSLNTTGVARTLYTEHLGKVDQFLTAIASNVPPGGELLDLLACWVIVLDMKQLSILPFRSLWVALVDSEAGYDDAKLDSVEFAFRSLKEFGDVAREWFSTPERAGQHLVCADVYARAALRVIRSLYHPHRNVEDVSLDSSMEVWFLFKILPGLLKRASYSQEIAHHLRTQPSFAWWIEQRFSNTSHYNAAIGALDSYCRQQEVETIDDEGVAIASSLDYWRQIQASDAGDGIS